MGTEFEADIDLHLRQFAETIREAHSVARMPAPSQRSNRLRMAVSAPDLAAQGSLAREERERIVRALATSLLGELAVLRWFESFVMVDPDATASFSMSSRPMTMLATDWGRHRPGG